MKFNYFFIQLFFIFISSPLFSQVYEWEKEAEGVVFGVVVDSSEYIYVAGLKTQIKDIYLKKFNKRGELVWEKIISASGVIELTLSIDNDQNILISGFYSYYINFDESSILTNNNSYQIFIAKFSPKGEFIQAKNVGELLDEIEVFDMRIDNKNNIYLKNSFFVAKFNSNFDLLWKISISNSISSYMDVSEKGDVFVAGSYYNELMLNDIQMTFNSNYHNIFYLLLNKEGDLKWLKTIQSSNSIGVYKVLSDNKDYYFSTKYLESISVNNNLINFKPNSAQIIKVNNLGDIVWASSSEGEEGFELTPRSLEVYKDKLYLFSHEEKYPDNPYGEYTFLGTRYCLFDINSGDIIESSLLPFNTRFVNVVKEDLFYSIKYTPNSLNNLGLSISLLKFHLGNLEELKNIIVYPVPASTIVNLNYYPSSLINEIIIYDSKGEIVYSKEVTSIDLIDFQIYVNDWAKGMYYGVIQDQTNKITKNFFKFIVSY